MKRSRLAALMSLALLAFAADPTSGLAEEAETPRQTMERACETCHVLLEDGTWSLISVRARSRKGWLSISEHMSENCQAEFSDKDAEIVADYLLERQKEFNGPPRLFE